jgi:hypothetical protein
VSILPRRRCRVSQLKAALRDRGGSAGGLAFARYLHRREGEFDAVLVERPFDHRVGLAPNHELLARHGHHLRPNLYAVEEGISGANSGSSAAQPDLLDQLPRLSRSLS